jgi:hypothetical protein
MTVLGVNCNTHCAFFAVAVNGELSTAPVEYIEAPNLVESSEELKSVLDELTPRDQRGERGQGRASEARGRADAEEDACGVRPEDRATMAALPCHADSSGRYI